jgi:hypothetical protein
MRFLAGVALLVVTSNCASSGKWPGSGPWMTVSPDTKEQAPGRLTVATASWDARWHTGQGTALTLLDRCEVCLDRDGNFYLAAAGIRARGSDGQWWVSGNVKTPEGEKRIVFVPAHAG